MSPLCKGCGSPVETSAFYAEALTEPAGETVATRSVDGGIVKVLQTLSLQHFWRFSFFAHKRYHRTAKFARKRNSESFSTAYSVSKIIFRHAQATLSCFFYLYFVFLYLIYEYLLKIYAFSIDIEK